MTSLPDLRGKVAIVGAATAGVGNAGGGYNTLELAAIAAQRALTDANLTTRQVDGLFNNSAYHFLPALSMTEYLNIRPKVIDASTIGGSGYVSYVLSAAMALYTGQCDVALICHGSNQLSGRSGTHGRLPSLMEPHPYEEPYEPRMPIAAYAMAAARHMHEYGTTREHLAEVAVAARKWAALNPEAYERGPLTKEDVLASKMICDPLTVRDCCLVTDGAGAVVMVRAEDAGRYSSNPVYFLGGGVELSHRQIASMPDLTVTAAKGSGQRAFAMARLSPQDVDIAELYDAFTINTLLFLEDLGFCPKGEGGRFVSDGGIAPGGQLPVNTNGGGLSFCHPGMYGIFTVIEAVRQLRGEADARQVKDAQVALCHGNGGVLSSQATVVLGMPSTL